MSNIEDLVPPLELCQQIPGGEFEDSALVWACLSTKPDEIWDVRPRIAKGIGGLPAPTLAEIMFELYEQNDFVGAKLKDGVCQVGCFKDDDDEAKVVIHAESMATAALKLYLELENGNAQKTD